MSRRAEQTSLLLAEHGMKVRFLKGLYWVIRKSNRVAFWAAGSREHIFHTAGEAIGQAEKWIREEAEDDS